MPPRTSPKETICACCGKPFTHPRYKARKYCGKACSGKAIGEQQRAKPKREPSMLNRVHVACAHCSALLVRKINVVAKSQKQFCNLTCKGEWARHHVTGDAHPLYSRVPVTCTQCHADMTVNQSTWKRQKHHFCSRDCYALWRAGRFTGSDSWTWKGGNRHKYYGENWKRQRRKARQRDQYKCRCCGISEKKLGYELDVHHIEPFRTFGLDRYREANRLRNLLPLCKTCHKKAEHQKIPIQPNLL